jgi:hypothetical protein
MSQEASHIPTMHVHAQHMQWLRRVGNGLHAGLPIEVNGFFTRKTPQSDIRSNALLGSRDVAGAVVNARIWT